MAEAFNAAHDPTHLMASAHGMDLHGRYVLDEHCGAVDTFVVDVWVRDGSDERQETALHWLRNHTPA